MSVRSVHSASSSVLKNLKVFRTFCSAILQYLESFIFVNCNKQQLFTVFIFCEVLVNLQKKIRQKLIPEKLVLAEINSLEVVAQVSFSVS